LNKPPPKFTKLCLAKADSERWGNQILSRENPLDCGLAQSKRRHQSQFHRSEIGRAERYLCLNFKEPLYPRLDCPAGGVVLLPLCPAIPCLHRGNAVHSHDDGCAHCRRIPRALVTEIALRVGYEMPSAFNKVRKKMLEMSPGNFRNRGKDSKSGAIYRLCRRRGFRRRSP
jgi:hypothetical protein